MSSHRPHRLVEAHGAGGLRSLVDSVVAVAAAAGPGQVRVGRRSGAADTVLLSLLPPPLQLWWRMPRAGCQAVPAPPLHCQRLRRWRWRGAGVGGGCCCCCWLACCCDGGMGDGCIGVAASGGGGRAGEGASRGGCGGFSDGGRRQQRHRQEAAAAGRIPKLLLLSVLCCHEEVQRALLVGALSRR